MKAVVFCEGTTDLHIRCLPEKEIGAIETIMLEALATDDIEESIIEDSKEFILGMAQKQQRYLQKCHWFRKLSLIHILRLELQKKSMTKEPEY